jgi:hypothetical protein
VTATGFSQTYLVKGGADALSEIVISVGLPERDDGEGWFCRTNATFLSEPILYGGATPEIALYNAFETMQRWVERDFGTLLNKDGHPAHLPVPPLPQRKR